MIYKKIGTLLWRLRSPEAWARHIGVSIGQNCSINTRNWSSEPYLISIGNRVGIAQDVYFHTHGGGRVARTQIPGFDVFGKICVEDGAYVGAAAHILGGVTIGAGSLIAAGSVVTKSVPAGEVWGGVPARKISTVSEYIERNLKYNTNTKGLSAKDKKKYLLSLPDEMFLKR